jgi:hypothetical protein
MGLGMQWDGVEVRFVGVRWLCEMGFFCYLRRKVAWDTVISDCREWMGENSLSLRVVWDESSPKISDRSVGGHLGGDSIRVLQGVGGG